MGKIFFMGFFFVCVKFMNKLSLDVILLNPLLQIMIFQEVQVDLFVILNFEHVHFDFMPMIWMTHVFFYWSIWL